MAVITMNGQIGSGAVEIGALVARRLGYDYVDRLILAEAAKRLGATVEVLAQKEQRSPTRGDRLARFLNTVMERSALAGSGADPYMGAGLGVLLGQDYPRAMEDPITRADQLEDERFIAVTKSVIMELADEGNVVIIGRASNYILKDRPDAFHVGVVSTLDARIKTITEREQVSPQQAKTITIEHERGRITYFRKYFQATVDNPADYHLMVNAHRMSPEAAARIVADSFLSLFKKAPQAAP
ncbi:MAG: cytidylate kinase-like family protein [Chloroflexi bacterium]|nr:cytidylate kinase-like family protein [Chloroflexota bacterium]